MNAPLARIMDIIRSATGTDISVFEQDFIARVVERRRRHATPENEPAYQKYLSEHPAEMQCLLAQLHNTYTDFFRDRNTSAHLELFALPSLVERKCESGERFIRVWSAGCSTGQEAYSIAMLLDEATTAHGGECTFHIFATDINTDALDEARRGQYERQLLGALRLKQFDTYFNCSGTHCEVVPWLKQKVDFDFYDLLDPDSMCPPSCIYGDFDVILCNNVLLYYRMDVRRLLLRKFHRSLAPYGILVVGESEREIVSQSDLFRRVAPSVSVFTTNNKT